MFDTEKHHLEIGGSYGLWQPTSKTFELATLIAIIPAKQKPPKEAELWYGDSGLKQAPVSAIAVTRWVFQRQNGSYVVVPDSERGRCWIRINL